MFLGFFDPLYFVFLGTRGFALSLYATFSHKIDVLKIFENRVT